MRREKREGLELEECPWLVAGHGETKCDTGDLLRICALAWRRQVQHDELEDPYRLLRAARSAGWLSYQGDPERKVLVGRDEQVWMTGRAQEFPEASHRRPRSWWESRYTWISETDEPQIPDYKLAGRNVHSLEYMKDEFPEQAPTETTKLHCMKTSKAVTLHCVELGYEDVCLFSCC